MRKIKMLYGEIKLKFTLVAFLFSAAVAVNAQVDVDYPCKKLVDKQKFDKAEAKINKVLTSGKPDSTYHYAAAKLYSSSSFSSFSPDEAYAHLVVFDSFMRTTNAKNKSKLEKKGYKEACDAEFQTISQLGLDLAEAENTVDAFNHFLAYYGKATKAQVRTAETRRNAIAYAEAVAQNTQEAFETFMSTYPNAAEWSQAKSNRDALAYAAVLRNGSLLAFQRFIVNYPDAEQVADAQSHVYQLAYNDAQRVGTEDAYRQYAQKYPDSPFASLALDKANSLQFIKETDGQGWTAYRDYIARNPNKTALVAFAQMEIFKYAKSAYDMEALSYGAKNFRTAYKDSCLLVLHDIYARRENFPDVMRFYDDYDVSTSQALKDLRRKDAASNNLYSMQGKTSPDFIKSAAPYTSALLALRTIVADDMEAKRWGAASKKVAEYESYFGDDNSFRNFYGALKAPADKKIRITSLGANVNTRKGHEYDAVISADEKTLLFCARRRTDNKGGEDIFMSRKVGGQWGKSKLVPDLNTSYGNEAPLALSADGTVMTLFRNGTMAISHKTASGWSEPEDLPSNINIASWQADAMLTSDGRAMLFAARKKTAHEFKTSVNIFVSVLDDDGQWAEPVELGPVINTPFDDRSPVLHPDMKTLYFCSEGHGALGGMDVFMSTRLRDDSWTEWSEPVSLGKDINTVEDECWYRITTAGKHAYFSKDVNDNTDIFCINLPEHLRPNPVATISGKLVDVNNKPVVTEIRWEDLDLHQVVGQSQTDPADGSFFIILPMGRNYGYFIDHEDYFPVANNLDLTQKNENVVVENDIVVASVSQMIEDEVPMPLNNIFFSVGDSVLMPTSVSELQRIASFIKKVGKKVEISGHTDDTGDDLRNQVLSEARAHSVRNALVEAGCDEANLVTVGYGKSKPIASNKTAEGRRRNRRVELRFIK